MIPKIINFVRTDYINLSPIENYCIQRWQNLNTDYQFFFYDDISGLAALYKFYPEYVSLWEESPPIVRTQIMRYLALYINGGTYVDTDVCPFVPLNNWIKNDDTFITISSAKIEHDFQFHARAGHDFFKDILQECLSRWSKVKFKWVLCPINEEQRLENMGLLFSCCSVSLFHELAQSYQRRILTEPYCDQYRFPWQYEATPKKNTYYTFHYALGSWCGGGRSIAHAKTFIDNTNKYF